VPYLEESLSLFRELGRTDDIALVLSDLGLTVLYLGEYERATELCEESLALSREMGDLRGVASWLANLATVTLARGDTRRATELCEESLTIRKGLGYKGGIAHTLAIMGRIALYQGAYERATVCYQESLTLRQETGEKEGLATALEGLAAVTGMQGQPVSAARLYGCTESLRNLLRAPLTPIDRAYYLQNVATLRAQLDESTFLNAWTAGQAMTLEEAIAEAVQVRARGDIPPTPGTALIASPLTVPPPGQSFGLTAREIEVLRLVTRGLTTTQIAQQLIMSPRTADAHLRSIYSKLEVTSRAAATRSALEHQLV
jgi:DNA-binding CsgD family transcriptional regulator/tetratricopeptide (TPR) repeat protein